MNLSLYEDVNSSIVVPSKSWQQLCSIINQLPEEEAENIYLLILHYYTVIENSGPYYPNIESKKLIYKGKTFENGKGAVFMLKNLPIPLQNIIAKYVTMITE